MPPPARPPLRRSILDIDEEPQGYVEPILISPFIRRAFPASTWPRLSPYFEHRIYMIFVEARPFPILVGRFPDEFEAYKAGQLFCMCYGPSCHEGEEGHHHVSALRPISPERFAAARAAGWDLE